MILLFFFSIMLVSVRLRLCGFLCRLLSVSML